MTTPIRRVLGLLLVLLALAVPAWAQTPGTWTEHQGTRLDLSAVRCGQPGAPAAPPGCVPFQLPSGGNNQFTSMINAWVDGDWDAQRKRFTIIRGGGHWDWPGNQVVAFDPFALAWIHLKDASLAYPTSISATFGPVYPDGSPASLHTYGCVAYMQGLDQFYSGGGIYWSPAGSSTPQTVFWWNPATGEYTKKPTTRPGGYGCQARWDPVLGKTLIRLASDFRAYDPATDSYQLVFSQSASASAGSSPLVFVGRTDGAASPSRIRMIDLDNLAAKEQTLLTQGDTGIEGLYGPGLVAVGSTLYGYGKGPAAGQGALYTMDLAQPCGLADQPKCTWVRQTPPDGVYPPAPHSNGTWKRLFYVPELGRAFVINAGGVNVWSVALAAPPPPSRVFTVQATGTGVCTPGGGGTYPHGTSVTATCEAAQGSVVDAWNAGCPGPLDLTADTVCVATASDVQAPAVMIQSPAAGAIIKQAGVLQIGYAATDNVAVSSVSCTVNGQAIDCGAWTIPADSPDGAVTLTVTARDTAGNEATAVRNVIIALCHCSGASQPIPEPGSPLVGLTPKTWKAIPSGPVGSQTKHTRTVYDSTRGCLVTAGGDGTGVKGGMSFTGQQVFRICLHKASGWETLHGWCPPIGGGSVLPSGADDITWVYDAKRDRALAMPAYYGGVTVSCAGVTYTKEAYGFDMNAKRWDVAGIPTPVPAWGGDLHNHFGVVDPQTYAVFRVYYGCGMQMIPLDSTTGACFPLSFPGAGGSNIWNMSNDQQAIDVQTGHIYAISRVLRSLVKWSIDQRKVVELIPMPTTWVAPTSEFGGWDYETYLAFDSKNRVLMNPNTVNYGGLLTGRGVNFYHVDTKVWTWEDAPAEVSGNNLAYDATNNAFLFLGRNAAKQFWLYRYQ